jgi:hypothetical protein
MQATVSRTTALEGLDVEHAAVRELIEALTNEEMTRPDTIQYGLYADQQLSFQDLLAHLITYEAYALEAIEAWKRGEKHWIVDAMLSPSRSRDVHYSGIEDRRGQSLGETLEEWERTQANLVEAIGNLSDEEWYSLAPYTVSTPTDLGGIMEIILVAPPRPVYRHLPVHIPDPQVYIRRLQSG